MRNNNFLPKETVLRIIDSTRTKEQMVDMIKGIPEVEAIEIKEGITNVDMIQAMFPNGIPKDVVWMLQGDKGMDWWNAPYKKGK